MELNQNYSKTGKSFNGYEPAKSQIINKVKNLSTKLPILEIFQKFFNDDKESNKYFRDKLRAKYGEDYENYSYTG